MSQPRSNTAQETVDQVRQALGQSAAPQAGPGPGVAENQARLRFFVTSENTPEQIANVIDAGAEELPKIRGGSSFVSTIASR